MPAPQNAGFTGISTEDINTASMESIFSSMSSEFTKTTGSGAGSRTQSGSSSQTATSTGASGTNASPTPTTLVTSASPSSTVSDSATPSLSSYSTGTATNAASSTSGAVTVSEKESSCNSISCSSALKAAVAVPIVVAVIAAIFLCFCCARRKGNQAGAVVSEKRAAKLGKKKWTRHLRAFSFDAELLMGGRFSSSNSLGSRDPSDRSGPGAGFRNGAHSTEPSMHSVEEVAPPYRDAITHATSSPPRPTPAVTTRAVDPIARPSSTATAPPPYKSIADGLSPEPTSPFTDRNPFSDSAPVSPIEESPFNDPFEAGGASGPALSRCSSMYRSDNTEDPATPTASEAGSIREAIVGRRVSVRKEGSTSGGNS